MVDAGLRPAPRRRKKAKGLWSSVVVPSTARLIRKGFRAPAATAMVLLFGVLCGTAMVNALVSQNDRHPAPLFASVTDKDTAKKLQKQSQARPTERRQLAQGPGFASDKMPGGFASPKQSEGFAPADGTQPETSPLVRELQDKLARQGLYTGAIDGMAGARTAAAIKAFEEQIGLPPTGEPSEALLRNIERARPEHGDQLRGLIAAASPPEQDELERVAAVQTALNAAGFGPLDVDGRFGRATRDAIESFERKFEMTVTGEPTAALLRQLKKRATVATR
jgi:peptidoglycan hydrolase-like protein with peptidoglycan-binding domain